MKVIVDTSVWSLALRRGDQSNTLCVSELRSLIKDHRVEMIGPIRQEILSGIRSESQFKKLQKHLESFPDLPPSPKIMLLQQSILIVADQKVYKAQILIF